MRESKMACTWLEVEAVAAERGFGIVRFSTREVEITVPEGFSFAPDTHGWLLGRKHRLTPGAHGWMLRRKQDITPDTVANILRSRLHVCLIACPAECACRTVIG